MGTVGCGKLLQNFSGWYSILVDPLIVVVGSCCSLKLFFWVALDQCGCFDGGSGLL